MTMPKTTARQKPIHAAYERCKDCRHHLHDLAGKGQARCMEVLEDKAGVLVERWLVGKHTLVLFSTPHWWNIFTAYDEDDNTVLGTLVYIDSMLKGN